ncbi:MAG: hydrogenase nickel incorporation protein HypA [Methanobacteriota archaeon]
MHEWALAESIILTALNTSKKEHIRTITNITIQIGELQQIESDILRFALKEILKQQYTKWKKVKFHIKTEKTQLQCTHCHNTWGFSEMKKTIDPEQAEAIHFIPEVAFAHTRCPQCRSPDFTIIKGRGATLSSIKGLG